LPSDQETDRQAPTEEVGLGPDEEDQFESIAIYAAIGVIVVALMVVGLVSVWRFVRRKCRGTREEADWADEPLLVPAEFF
jgi:hypothetical protein